MWCDLVTCCPGINIVLQMFSSASRARMCVASFNFPLGLPTLAMLLLCHWLLVSPSHTALIRGKLPPAKRIHAAKWGVADRALCHTTNLWFTVVWYLLLYEKILKARAINWNVPLSCKVWLSIYWRSVCDTELLVFPLQWHNRVLINNLTLGN